MYNMYSNIQVLIRPRKRAVHPRSGDAQEQTWQTSGFAQIYVHILTYT